jgi:hypothetical protein
MLKSLPLHLLYRNQNGLINSKSPLFELVGLYLSDHDINLDDFELAEFPLSEEEVPNYLEDLLAFVILINFSPTEPSHLGTSRLGTPIHSLLNQLPRMISERHAVILSLIRHLAGLPPESISLNILEGGATQLQTGDYRPWEAQPYAPDHARCGVLLCLLAYLTKADDLRDTVFRIAKWHLNTLDADFFPMVGLFSREKNGSPSLHLIWNYLFFYAVGSLMGEPKYVGLSERYVGFLDGISASADLKVAPLLPLIEELIRKERRNTKREVLSLSEHVYDSSMALVGTRNGSSHVVCTLRGGYSGLGSLRVGDVRILSYGPHHLPLEECLGFGIEGNHSVDHGVRQSWIDVAPSGFSLKGCVRLVDHPIFSSDPVFHFGKLSGIWLEVEQLFQSPHFYLRTQFLGFEGWGSLAFSFFVKAQRCSVASQSLTARSLNRYEGEVHDVLLEGEEGLIRLNSSQGSSMQIIPLGSNENFWGADFLIAYMLDSKQSAYDWNMSFEH